MNSVPSLLVADNGWEPVGGSYDNNRLQSVSNFIYSGRVSSYQWNGPGFSQPPSPAPAFHAALRRPQPVTAELLGNRAASATGTASLPHAQGQPGEPAARPAHRDTLRLTTRDLFPSAGQTRAHSELRWCAAPAFPRRSLATAPATQCLDAPRASRGPEALFIRPRIRIGQRCSRRVSRCLLRPIGLSAV